ncbi:zinc ABC transporter substrate-binding protein [Photobacterium sp. BZF1]|uniref:zinc ABC transporter substrate-binding protein n=1 Tax=Photobacterium sp. BZF1 TaxID=1904457 RepID=UPI0016537C05|nr:zinc ABC transporter substrate-binding protein [Photobacterium sp. BZF1]MBC7003367.1 zinc ABC transporter substrate-binding protein [Photobacterium sp. BZF1]
MRRLLLTCSTFGLLVAPTLHAEELKVVSTVKPVTMIVQELTQGVTSTETLLPAGASPHDYALRPSDVRKLNEADLVIWVGPELERFLIKVLDDKENVLTLTAQNSINFRHYGDDHDDHDDHGHDDHDGHDHDKHAHDDHDHDHDDHAHDDHDGHDHDKHAHDDHDDHHHHEGIDPHLWLGPEQAVQAAQVITEKLISVAPANKDIFEKNLANFSAEVRSTVAAIEQTLTPVSDRGYFVFHDAYGYFEDQFGLNNLGHFTVEPDRRPGAKTLITIRNALKDQHAACVFSEPQFSPAVVDSVARGTGVNIGTLDPLATEIEYGQGSYVEFLNQLTQSYSQCLQ